MPPVAHHRRRDCWCQCHSHWPLTHSAEFWLVGCHHRLMAVLSAWSFCACSKETSFICENSWMSFGNTRTCHQWTIHIFVLHIEGFRPEWCISTIYRGFPIRMMYLHYTSCSRYTILVGNPQYYCRDTSLVGNPRYCLPLPIIFPAWQIFHIYNLLHRKEIFLKTFLRRINIHINIHKA